ncbi:HET-domain-containing protein [Dendrothele bispora CBS 962.96]|uniref:HET-domain-containing protein n=1 Tax=Dendrothele bispora (strain CBS 962.96) TaxID=1314807 RepID=A0A4S8LZ45_DENBC|nr:HET-domain-containing protein [Dendrothele bispora CBS 962.96]
MYLLNTRTLTLRSFYADIPDYAILSHTWRKKEVTFQDIRNRDKKKSDREVPDRDKSDRQVSRDDRDLEDSDMEDTRKYDWDWIWIDSCCIDKSSSAELSENINSMYQLYENAGVCYVYLSDASSEEDPRDTESRFWKSKWFTRGWTLQELIAPSASVVFLDHSWDEIGTRYSLRDVISAITSVPNRHHNLLIPDLHPQFHVPSLPDATRVPTPRHPRTRTRTRTDTRTRDHRCQPRASPPLSAATSPITLVHAAINSIVCGSEGVM